MDHDIRPLYFDVAGAEMTRDDFMKAYPERMPVVRTMLLRTAVCTEFVGIDHRQATEHKLLISYPMIYETSVVVKVEGFAVHRTFAWSGGLKRARLWHVLACVTACLGGALWWRYCAYNWGSDDDQRPDL